MNISLLFKNRITSDTSEGGSQDCTQERCDFKAKCKIHVSGCEGIAMKLLGCF